MTDVRAVQVTFDCADPGALAVFWRQVLGYVEEPPPAGHSSWEQALEAFGVPRELWNSRSACIDPRGVGPRLFFQQVPEGKTVKNRIHFDLWPTDCTMNEEVERLLAHGATMVRDLRDHHGPGSGWVTLADPEGNEFCVLRSEGERPDPYAHLVRDRAEHAV